MDLEVKAVAKNVGISPLKVRRVADLVRRKRVEEALVLLRFTPIPAARALAKVIRSAAANAENNHQLVGAELKISNIFIDQGHTLKRGRPQARGRFSPWLRHSSHITVVVEG